jgi:superfamily II DNA or RNA helicase
MHVKIGRTYNLCSLEPWIKGLERELTFTKVEHRHGYVPEGEERVIRNHKALYHVPVETPTLGCFPAGLLPRVIEWLVARKHTYEIRDHRDLERTRPEPDFSKLDKLRPGQDKAILQIATADMGIIKAATAFGKSFVIRQACKMYPKTRFLITSKRVSVVSLLYRRLVEELGEEMVGQVGGGKVQTGRRITVATTKSMMKVDPQEVDILFFDEVHNVGDNDVAKTLGYFDSCRMFGFTASPVRGDKTEMCMEALFGRFLVEFEYEDAVELGNVVPLDVYMVTVGGHIREASDTTRNKRTSYWNNERRNKVIAKAARRIDDNEQCLIMVETLEHAMQIHQYLPDYTVVHFGNVRLPYHAYELKKIARNQARRVPCLVNTGGDLYTHMDLKDLEGDDRQLYAWVSANETEKQYLERRKAAGLKSEFLGRFSSYEELKEKEFDSITPGSYVLIRQEEYVAGHKKSELAITNKEKERIQKDFESGKLKKVIATGTWKEGVDFDQLAVLIRADGATSEIDSTQIPGRLSRLSPGKDRGMLVDFDDQFNGWARRRSQQRLRTYRGHGWNIVT